MNMGDWKETHNATEDYLIGKKSFTIVSTRLKNTESKTYKAMFAWCLENVEGSWGPGSLEKYDFFITWRFWRNHEAIAFQSTFKRFITNIQTF